jgi:hypothetical protein
MGGVLTAPRQWATGGWRAVAGCRAFVPSFTWTTKYVCACQPAPSRHCNKLSVSRLTSPRSFTSLRVSGRVGSMSVELRLGIFGGVMALAGIAITVLWPDKKWIGWACLMFAAALAIWWLALEIKSYPYGQLLTIAAGAVIGGGVAAIIWDGAMSSSEKPQPKLEKSTTESSAQEGASAAATPTIPEQPAPTLKTAFPPTGTPSPSIDGLYLSLKRLLPEESIMFLKEPLDSGQEFYRFQVRNNGSDLSDVTIALDLPALLAKQPILIDRTGADNLALKAAFSAYVRTIPGKPPERIADLNNTAILDLSRLKNSDFIDIGLVTAPIKDRQIVMITAPDGSIQMTTSPHYGRYGSVSVKRPKDGGLEARSFTVGAPVPNIELIDRSNPLRPWSRTVLSLLTQDEMVENMNKGIRIQVEQHFN